MRSIINNEKPQRNQIGSLPSRDHRQYDCDIRNVNRQDQTQNPAALHKRSGGRARCPRMPSAYDRRTGSWTKWLTDDKAREGNLCSKQRNKITTPNFASQRRMGVATTCLKLAPRAHSRACTPALARFCSRASCSEMCGWVLRRAGEQGGGGEF